MSLRGGILIAGEMAVTATRHGKHLRKTDWKDPPFFMGKLTISMAMFNSFLYVYQRILSIEWSHQCGALLWFDLV